MAELLDRTNKSRCDWGIMMASSLVDHIISFAWDADYLCVPMNSGYTKSLNEQIMEDIDRPILSNAIVKGSNITVMGYNIVTKGTTFLIAYKNRMGLIEETKGHVLAVDPSWGIRNNRQPYLQSADVYVAFKDGLYDGWYLKIDSTTQNGKQNYQSLYIYY